MSSNFENNKIFAAILCALLTIMLSGFFVGKIVKPEKLEKDAVFIDGASDGAHGASAPKKPQLPEPIMAILASADVAKGAKISKACAACHSFGKGGPVKQGPNLWAIVNAKKGSAAGFKYSDGLLETGGQWNYDSLNKFLWKPKKYAPGTKMNFAGLKKANDRAAMIAWLREQSDSKAALPTEAEIAAEQLAFAPPVVEEEAHAEDGTEHDGAEMNAPSSAH